MVMQQIVLYKYIKNKLTSSYPAKLATESPQFCELIVLPFKISSVAILLQVQFS